MQLGWSLPLILDAHAKCAFETLSGVDDGLGNFTLEDSHLRCMAHLEPAARTFRSSDNFEIGDWHEVPDFQLTFAHNGQGRRLYTIHADDAARTPPKNHGLGTGQ